MSGVIWRSSSQSAGRSKRSNSASASTDSATAARSMILELLGEFEQLHSRFFSGDARQSRRACDDQRRGAGIVGRLSLGRKRNHIYSQVPNDEARIPRLRDRLTNQCRLANDELKTRRPVLTVPSASLDRIDNPRRFSLSDCFSCYSLLWRLGIICRLFCCLFGLWSHFGGGVGGCIGGLGVRLGFLGEFVGRFGFVAKRSRRRATSSVVSPCLNTRSSYITRACRV